MKAFFEEYGRTIVTVLIILGIILVGYTLAGNGKTSAFGRFTSDVVDSLSGQANSLLADSPENIERATSMSTEASTTSAHSGNTKMTSVLKDGIYHIGVAGKSIGDYTGDNAMTYTDSTTDTPWDKQSVMSFDIMADKKSGIVIDLNARIDGVSINDCYAWNSQFSIDGNSRQVGGTLARTDLSAGKWHHIVLVMRNANEKLNLSHKPMQVFNTIHYVQDDETVNYQIKNLKYGVAD